MDHIFWIVIALICFSATRGEFQYWTGRDRPNTTRGRIIFWVCGLVLYFAVRMFGEYALGVH